MRQLLGGSLESSTSRRFPCSTAPKGREQSGRTTYQKKLPIVNSKRMG
ncbi:hypothetical protein D187_004758 [Cystobacter fuscus DSM 2262]|uniref:Uncharacterized protein n=1 Tax=Cystobacter fuscus (strain ATCC 25194 / DSM 2262 / NBRC 100088 / M29) TaxID=1242864 RepID=S9QMI7_CYSF2|nr:hypothetical protein D187_004758 [Cystobacter fuscus DSM 2262]